MATLISSAGIFSSVNIRPSSKNLVAAYSGGLDSHVLLHALKEHASRIGCELIAVHINHGLSDYAESWVMHCRHICDVLNIDLRVVTLDATAPPGESQEAWARSLRYQALEKYIGDDDVLFTAHHGDDQIETLLIQLFRGSGPAGLAAMPQERRFGKGWHYRPLLEYTRVQLETYARAHQLEWIEDASNAEDRYDRNYLRKRIMPLISRRWPGIAHTLSRAATHQAQAADLMDVLARRDILLCRHPDPDQLSIHALKQLPWNRAANTIRYWIKSAGFPLPTERQLLQVRTDILNASPASAPCVSWPGTRIRRYRDRLCLGKPLPETDERMLPIEWDSARGCDLPLGRLEARPGKGRGISLSRCADGFMTINYRAGGETIKKGGHHHRLGKLFQEYGVPTWYRDLIPLIYIDGKLAAVAGLCIDEDFSASGNEDSLELVWTAAETVYAGKSLNPETE